MTDPRPSNEPGYTPDPGEIRAGAQPAKQRPASGVRPEDARAYAEYSEVSDAELPAGRGKPASPGWAIGFIALGASLLIMAGVFQFISGLTAVLDDEFFVRTQNYTFRIDTTTWGWIHMGIGIVMGLAGLGLFTGNIVARVVGVIVALASAVSNFFFIPYYPV